jgi:hypothetical protein
MGLSMFGAAVPVFLQGLAGLDRVLDRGAAHAAEHGMEDAELTAARLAPDMFPLSRQVQIATDHCKGAVCRLSGREVPSWPDTETSFAELRGRVAKAAEIARSVGPGEIDGTEAKAISLKVGQNMMDFTGQAYLLHFALPNFWFHVVTAYDILRMSGVKIGKGDFFAR